MWYVMNMIVSFVLMILGVLALPDTTGNLLSSVVSALLILNAVIGFWLFLDHCKDRKNELHKK